MIIMFVADHGLSLKYSYAYNLNQNWTRCQEY